MARLSLVRALVLLATCGSLTAAARTLDPDDVPGPLRGWIPWALFDATPAKCPTLSGTLPAHRQCVLPTALEIDIAASGARFALDVTIIGERSPVALPGGEAWPLQVRAGGSVLPVVERDGVPTVLLPVGQHRLSGEFSWQRVPGDLQVPVAIANVAVLRDGKRTRLAPDANGRIVLADTRAAEGASNSETLRVSRLIDDDVPTRLHTRIDLVVAGAPRELRIPAAAIAPFEVEAISGPLAAQLSGTDLHVQVRPGTWAIDLQARAGQPVKQIVLPAAAKRDEVWSYKGRGDLRLALLEGLPSLDPKQVPMPDEWRGHQTYRMQAGQTATLTEKYRGNAHPQPDRFQIQRDLWLDFDGRGYTARDHIGGAVTRAWRIEAGAHLDVGRVAANDIDQPVTRRTPQSPPGVELRTPIANLVADSRIARDATLTAVGWDVDAHALQGTLHLPPGWMLLHAQGPDAVGGSWVSRWSLYDFFAVLIITLAAAKLFGRRTGALALAALVLSWHTPGAPHAAWLVVLAGDGLARVLPPGKLAQFARMARWAAILAIALSLIPYVVTQCRLALHPALEQPWQSLGEARPTAPPVHAPAPAAAPAAPPARQELAKSAGSSIASLDRYAGIVADTVQSMAEPEERTPYAQFDPTTRITTGPGIPTWNWITHHPLTWTGPVTREQGLDLYLLSPPAHGVLRILTALALGLLLATLAGLRWPRGGLRMPAGALPLLLAAAIALQAGDGWALEPPNAALPAKAAIAGLPDKEQLEELARRVAPPPQCLPQCASLARASFSSVGDQLRLTIEAHAAADVLVPVLGHGGGEWIVRAMRVDGRAASARRGDDGQLALRLEPGVHQVELDLDVGSSAAVSLSLPLPIRKVTSSASGWQLAGLDGRGGASGALTLTRAVRAGAAGTPAGRQEVFPPYLRIERTLDLGLEWRVHTRIVRDSASAAPMLARVHLLPDERVLDPAIKVVDGIALVQLGQGTAAAFASALPVADRLVLVAAEAPRQSEQWVLRAAPQWSIALKGIPPVLGQAPAQPRWLPWPAEKVEIEVGRPRSIDGSIATTDRSVLQVTPGRRETAMLAQWSLRASQALPQVWTLPAGGIFDSLTIDGQRQLVQVEDTRITTTIPPGKHQVDLAWREARGIETRFVAAHLPDAVAGSNVLTTLNVPADRVALLLGGDGVGPAVLFWSVLVVIVAVSWGLARTGWTPLGFGAWVLLGMGLAQRTVLGALVVVSLFFVLYARQRWVERLDKSGWFNVVQILIGLWAVAAATILLDAVRGGLLGYPDLLIEGNASTAQALHWYLDRSGEAPASVWMVSVPLWIYRAAMLVWALWLAFSVLRWVRWAWAAASTGGYWRAFVVRLRRAPAADNSDESEGHDAPGESVSITRPDRPMKG